MSSPRRDFSVVWPGGPSWQGPHRVGSFALCPQQEAFAHDLHLRPVIEKLPSAVGTLLHAGLAYRYASILPKRPPWYVYNSPQEAINVLAKNEEHRDLALKMMAAYEVRYAKNTWTPVYVEEQLAVRFPNGEPYTARVDLIAWEGRDLCLIDHKSVGEITTSIGYRYRADRQMLTGLAIARRNNLPITKVIINAISRKTTDKNGNEIGHQCKRFDIAINPVGYERIERDTLYWLEAMKQIRAARPDPYDRPRNWEACTSREYGPCDFYGLCTGEGSMSDYHVPEEYLKGRLKS